MNTSKHVEIIKVNHGRVPFRCSSFNSIQEKSATEFPEMGVGGLQLLGAGLIKPVQTAKRPFN